MRMKSRLWGWMALLLLACVPASGNGDSVTAHVVFHKAMMANLATKDLEAAAKVWIDALGDESGAYDDCVVYFVEDVAEVHDITNPFLPDLVILSCWDYLHLKTNTGLKATTTIQRGGSKMQELVLVARKDVAFETIADLEGASICMIQNELATLSTVWLETMLGEQDLPDPDSFFGERRRVSKASLALLPVFFGQVDVCVVSRNGYDTMAELNPQLGRDLSIVAESQGLVSIVICVNDKKDGNLKSVLPQALSAFHENAHGEQILLGFRVDRMVPLQASDLEAMLLFKERYEAVTAVGPETVEELL